MSLTGKIGISPVKIMAVTFLHQVNCETKYTIPELFDDPKWSSRIFGAVDDSATLMHTGQSHR